MRYHIASLVAVFLALTVGLLLGSLIVDKGVLTKQQEKLFDSIRSDIDTLNSENASLRQKADQLESFQEQVFPLAVRSRLTDMQVVVVTMADGKEALVDELAESLGKAGAQTTRVHISVDKLDFSKPQLVKQLGDKFGAGGIEGGDFERRFWARLAGEMAGQEQPALMDELVAAELMSRESTTTPMENIVVLAATKNQVDGRDALLFDALSQIGQIRVIGVETSDTKPSRIAAYKLRNVSTIDNVDKIPGRISLVYLLEEREVTAHFGQKSTADRFMP